MVHQPGASGTGPAAGPDRHQDPVVVSAAELLRVLGSPHRLAIVLALTEEPHCVHELVDLLGISQSLVSQHLRVLRNTRLVRGTRRGRETLYSLADTHVAQIAHDALAHSDEAVPASGHAAAHRPRTDTTNSKGALA